MPVLISSGIKYGGNIYNKSRFISADYIDQNQIQVVDVSSNKEDGVNAIDMGGSEDEYLTGEVYPEWKIWVTESNVPPHYIIIDLGKNEMIKGFTYSPRIDGIELNEGVTGNILNFEVYVADKINNYGEIYYKGELSGKRQREMISFNPVYCRYVKLVITKGIDGKAAIADLRFFR